MENDILENVVKKLNLEIKHAETMLRVSGEGGYWDPYIDGIKVAIDIITKSTSNTNASGTKRGRSNV